MDPFSATGLTALGMATGAGSGILGAIGAGESSAASSSAYRYKAGLATMNQRINQQNASWATEAGETNAMLSGLKSRQTIGSTKVQQSGSGFDVNSGSPEAVRDSQGKAAAFDQDMIRYDASKTAYGYEAKASADEAESRMMLSASENERKAGKLKIAASILGGASSVAGKWSQGTQVGMFGKPVNPYYAPLDGPAG